MEEKKLLECLKTLDSFCMQNRIDYVLTGTAALYLLGIPYKPDDIDIKVFSLTDQQRNKIEELQKLAGFKTDDYGSCHTTCYSFSMLGHIKVNVLYSVEPDLNNPIQIRLDSRDSKSPIISVQPVFDLIKAKMRLKRDKDRVFMLELINKLTSL